MYSEEKAKPNEFFCDDCGHYYLDRIMMKLFKDGKFLAILCPACLPRWKK